MDQTGDKAEIEHLLEEEEGSHRQPVAKPRPRNWFNLFFYGLFVLSINFNILQAIVFRDIAVKLDKGVSEQLSNFAKLRDNEISTEFVMYSEYASKNATYRDSLWEPVGEASGTVAVPKTWAVEKDLPLGREVPWDDSQSLYAINAYHSLHCIKAIYVSLMNHRLSQPQEVPENHVYHCLDQLRADVVCAADDTLRAGDSTQPRRCRDFNKLEAWMNEYPSCIPEKDDSRLKERVHIPVLRSCVDNPLG